MLLSQIGVVVEFNFKKNNLEIRVTNDVLGNSFTEHFLNMPEKLKISLTYNTNDLIRDFFPKGTNFSKVGREKIEHV